MKSLGNSKSEYFSNSEPRICKKDTILWFGKHKGQTISWALANDIGWVKWALEKGIIAFDYETKVIYDTLSKEESYKYSKKKLVDPKKDDDWLKNRMVEPDFLGSFDDDLDLPF